MIQGRFEAKKHAFRQTQEGVVISFVLHPSDVTPELAAAPLGTILEIDYREPSEEPETPVAELVKPAARDKPRAPFHTLPRAQQAGIACADPEFQRWLGYKADPRDDKPEEIAARWLRDRLAVRSRTDLDDPLNDMPGRRWDALYTEYMIATGRMASPRV